MLGGRDVRDDCRRSVYATGSARSVTIPALRVVAQNPVLLPGARKRKTVYAALPATCRGMERFAA